MTRSTAREIAIHLALSMDYTHADTAQATQTLLETDYYAGLGQEHPVYEERPNKKQLAYIEAVAEGCVQHKEELDGIISQYSIGWAIHRLPRLVKAILRVALFEILYVEDVPTGVAINEAVRLTREYEDEELVAFVNGILGSFARARESET